jgi:hypothetical protein
LNKKKQGETFSGTRGGSHEHVTSLCRKEKERLAQQEEEWLEDEEVGAILEDDEESLEEEDESENTVKVSYSWL